MKWPKLKKPGSKKTNGISSLKTRSFRMGGYSVAATAIVLAIVITANVFIQALPARITQFDTTSNQLFTISQQTEQIVGGLEEEVRIYWIVQSGQEDGTLETLLSRYTAMNSKIHVEKKDPDVYPNFVQQYVTDSVYNNSLIVESGERYRYVSYSEIYEYDYSNYYTTGSYDVSFAGEGALTSAISYVTSEDLPKMYLLTGHGESALPTTFETAVQKENIETEELSLLTVEAVPEDADCVLVYAPQSDIAEEEKALLLSYLQGGGKLILITDPPSESDSRPNWDALMAEYGVQAADGVVVEGSQQNYAWDMPYYLLPDIASHTITSPLIESGYYVLLSAAQGLTIDSSRRDSVSVTELLTTSDAAFSKISGYAMDTFEKEADDLDGPFALAVAITETIDVDQQTQIVWVSSSSLLDEQANLLVSGGNQDFFLNTINWMCQQEDNISIHSKSLSYEYLTMDSSTSSMLTVLVVGILPAVYLGVGITIWIRRKRR